MGRAEKILALESAFSAGNYDEVARLLPELINKNVPQAIRINACVGQKGLSQSEMDKHYVSGIKKAAELGDQVAIFHMALWHNNGEFGYSKDPVTASKLFQTLADKLHVQSMCIHAENLISGQTAFTQDIAQGIKLLKKASFLGSVHACMVLADLYDKGELGLDVNPKVRDAFIKTAQKYDNRVTNPYL